MSPAAAADFMSRVVPWPAAGQAGFINLHWTQPKKTSSEDVWWRGRALKSVPDFMSAVASALADPASIKGIYFCLSLQGRCGKPINGAVAAAARSSKEAKALKAIWLDVDVREGPGGYPTLEDALRAVLKFARWAGIPEPTALVSSGRGLHIYWISDRALSVDEWRPYAEGLKARAQEFGLRADLMCTADAARILRVPGTFNHKLAVRREVKLLELRSDDLDFATGLRGIVSAQPRRSITVTVTETDPARFPESGMSAAFARALDPHENLADGIHHRPNLSWHDVERQCAFFRDAKASGGREHSEPLWNQALLAATFFDNGEALAHELSNQHPGYSVASTTTKYQQKLKQKETSNLGYPSCTAIQTAGCSLCKACPHLGKVKSPLNLGIVAGSETAEPVQPMFVDPYEEYVGPPFPMEVLPPTLKDFVEAKHRAMGVDSSALAMAALTVAAGAMDAQTTIRVSDGWSEKPLIWTALIGPPSAMKSPVLDSALKPLKKLDKERHLAEKAEYQQWRQANPGKNAKSAAPPPKKGPRALIYDTTSEKVAELLARDPRGSFMVHDELASWLGSFERYNAGASSRGFFLTCWNGGPHRKDRVGKGATDPDAEIYVENLALSVLGGIQPDKLKQTRDLTIDGLLQRFLLVLMAPAGRGDHYYSVSRQESAYEQLILSISKDGPQAYDFDEDALEIRDRLFDYLHSLTSADGFSSALQTAVGKLNGYFARLCLVLEVAWKRDPDAPTTITDLGWPKPQAGTELANLFEALSSTGESLADGIRTSHCISRPTAERAETLIRDFVLPHLAGFYRVVISGEDKDLLVNIADFVLSTSKDRLRPSDVTSGVRALRGQPYRMVQEWMSRFSALGWIEPEHARPGAPPTAWLVAPGLREHFGVRAKKAAAARSEAHAILRAGGTRKSTSRV